MDRYAVIGHPVAHSLSPWIHAEFASATGQALRYERLAAAPDAFAATAAGFFVAGGAGLNVTLPFKAEAAGWVEHLDGAAAAAGAVNTIIRSRGRLVGCNTDGAGLLRDLEDNCGIDLHGARILLVGAGGAAHGVARPLLAARPSALCIANRTLPRAEALAAVLRAEGHSGSIDARLPAQAHGSFDLIINATSAGLDGDRVPALPGSSPAGAFCYDMLYARDGRAATGFCRWADAHGAARCSDGLGMLVEQAALAFALWRGILPSTAGVLGRLRQGLAATEPT